MMVAAAAGLLLAGCARYYGLVETDVARMQDCACIGTFAETANPGREDGGILKHYADTTEVKRRVLQRAALAGATHVVWMHAYSVAAAAQAYRCAEAVPLAAADVSPDRIWEEDLD